MEQQKIVLPCGHEHDFSHVLSLVVGKILAESPLGFMMTKVWHKLQDDLVREFHRAFEVAKALQPNIPAPSAPEINEFMDQLGFTKPNK